MEFGETYLVLACLFGLLMAWGVGANDVANAMGTSVGSRAVTLKQALIIATIFEFSGAFLAGGQVTETIRQGIINTDVSGIDADTMIYGMMAALLAAASWLFIASTCGWPVSTTHTIIGAIIGFGCYSLGIDAIKWGKVSHIVASWVISPVMGGVVAYALFQSVNRFILNTDNPILNAKKMAPVYIFIASWAVSMVTLVKGLKHIGINLNFASSNLLSIAFSFGISIIGIIALKNMKTDPSLDKDFQFANVEKIFTILMIFTACAMAFAHGSNDVANAIGPLAAVVNIVESGGKVGTSSLVPWWVLLIGSIGIVAGLVMYGHKVIATVGEGITELTPSRGFAATLAAALTVVIASGSGLPISTTHTLVGAVLGVGLARGIGALNISMISTIFMSWIITLPAGAILSVIFFYILKTSFGFL